MAELIIVGAGGFGRETAEAVRAINERAPTWDLLGFLDDDPFLAGAEREGVRVLGPTGDIARWPDAAVAVCTGRPDDYASRKRLVGRLGLDPGRYATLVHPAAAVATSAEIGPGTVILATAVVTAAARVGSHVAVMPGVVLTHDDVVGDYASLAAGVRLGGRARVGEGAYLGAGAVVGAGLTIGAWSLVGMGAVVVHQVPPREVWAGVPARRLRAVDEPAWLVRLP
jgi:sugar O-acyltransferase (sialic acid O-acetyltransferase NeuD family)